ncbi:MAG: EscU/YscU/HrcU family type III secretion system export apparatus switch protein [Planctomycetota bacterium]|nr:MAG: EscU/YscU/HrcU family type III secretion system export apparatus switch protein [Planctomycetota bacterium]
MSGEKTEKPTPKKIRQAREEGNVPKSRDFQSSVLFLIGAAVIGSAGPAAVDRVKAFALACFEAGSFSSDRLLSATLESAHEGLILILLVVAPLLGAVVITTLLIGFAQTGGLLTFKVFQLKFERLNPATGIKNLFFSARTYVELLKSLVKLTVAFVVAYFVIRGAIRDIASASGLDVEHLIALAALLTGKLIKVIGGVLLVIGLADLLWQRYQWTKGLMMSKQEIKDEYKQAEGDPHTKSQRKKMAREIANQKGIKSVRKAKVVVTNPHEIAVALEYDEDDPNMNAPRVLCKGERIIAQQIIEEAKRHGVPIMRNIALAHSLNELEVDDEIPEELYEAVAELLNWVYALEAGEVEPGPDGAFEPPEPGEQEDEDDLDW